MVKLYSEKSVRELVQRLKEEYEEALRRAREMSAALKRENAALRGRLSLLEGERGEVSEALVRAVKEGERIREESAHTLENEKRELRLLADKCRILLNRLDKKYPEEEDVRDFRAFTEALGETVSPREEQQAEESGFDMEEVLSPKQPLDLGKLCKDLGLMEGDE